MVMNCHGWEGMHGEWGDDDGGDEYLMGMMHVVGNPKSTSSLVVV